MTVDFAEILAPRRARAFAELSGRRSRAVVAMVCGRAVRREVSELSGRRSRAVVAMVRGRAMRGEVRDARPQGVGPGAVTVDFAGILAPRRARAFTELSVRRSRAAAAMVRGGAMRGEVRDARPPGVVGGAVVPCAARCAMRGDRASSVARSCDARRGAR